MFSGQQAEMSLNVPMRTLQALRGDKEESRFIAGTCGMDDTMYLHVLRFHSDLNQLRHEIQLEHPSGPVLSIATSPSDKSMLVTATESSPDATLWKIPGELLDSSNSPDYTPADDEDDYPPAEMGVLEQRAVLTSLATIVDIKWRGGDDDDPHMSSSGEVLTLDQKGNLTQWDVAFGAGESTRQYQVDASKASWNLPPHMSWDPHAADSTAISVGTDVSLLDWRNPSAGVETFWCHRYGITSLDYNPNKPHTLVTAGQEGLLKFWDLRSHKQPLLTVRGGHRHWAMDVKYNPFHDQLIISAGTDSAVNLWRISTISSAPLLTLEHDDTDDPATTPASSNTIISNNNSPNVVVSRLDHMNSVYATAWGAADAWIYASLSYDGNVVLNHVPSKEKYKILL
jgi:EARP and GARP complex-interacting protein 1